KPLYVACPLSNPLTSRLCGNPDHEPCCPLANLDMDGRRQSGRRPASASSTAPPSAKTDLASSLSAFRETASLRTIRGAAEPEVSFAVACVRKITARGAHRRPAAAPPAPRPPAP